MTKVVDYTDLKPRLFSAAFMAGVAFVALLFGGMLFALLLSLIGALMCWEMARMHEEDLLFSSAVCGLSGLTLFCAMVVSGFLSLILLALLVALIWQKSPEHRLLVAGSVLAILLACTAIYTLRDHSGFGWALWFVLCVIGSDVGGYFAGKHFGGPKLWIRISPKKTWSGTIGGWALAAFVGMIFAVLFGLGSALCLMLLSILVAIAAQAGDLVESAIKRRAGVKDSSDLIPGHGGVSDRFDGFAGAGVLVGLAQLVT